MTKQTRGLPIFIHNSFDKFAFSTNFFQTIYIEQNLKFKFRIEAFKQRSHTSIKRVNGSLHPDFAPDTKFTG